MSIPNWQDDLHEHNLPHDEKAFDKIKCVLKHGMRVWWYYAEDVKYAAQDGYDVRAEAPFSGLLVAAPDMSLDSSELDYDECVVIMDEYPTEKCGCEATYIALSRLLDNEDLVEIFSMEEENSGS